MRFVAGRGVAYQSIDHRCAYRVHNVDGELKDEDDNKHGSHIELGNRFGIQLEICV